MCNRKCNTWEVVQQIGATIFSCLASSYAREGKQFPRLLDWEVVDGFFKLPNDTKIMLDIGLKVC